MRIQHLECLRNSRALVLIAGIVGAFPSMATSATAQTESIIYNFPANSAPVSRPFENSSGGFFVTAPNDLESGTAIEVSENHGVWKGRDIFKFNKVVGRNPIAGVIADDNGV